MSQTCPMPCSMSSIFTEHDTGQFQLSWLPSVCSIARAIMDKSYCQCIQLSTIISAATHILDDMPYASAMFAIIQHLSNSWRSIMCSSRCKSFQIFVHFVINFASIAQWPHATLPTSMTYFSQYQQSFHHLKCRIEQPTCMRCTVSLRQLCQLGPQMGFRHWFSHQTLQITAGNTCMIFFQNSLKSDLL